MRICRNVLVIALSSFSIGGFAVYGSATAQAQVATRQPGPEAEAAGPRARFTGTFRYAGSTEEQEARRAAIDHAVAGMFFAIRSTARTRLTATTQILESYTFSFEPGKIRVLPQSRPVMISGDKGEPADYVYNGKTSALSQRFVGDRILQVFSSDDGKRENEYTLSGDGQTLTLRVTITSGRLPSPLVYLLSYRKAA